MLLSGSTDGREAPNTNATCKRTFKRTKGTSVSETATLNLNISICPHNAKLGKLPNLADLQFSLL